MPKFTRHELFCKAFNEFLSNHINIETVNDESIELTSFGPINDYKLINTTGNKSGNTVIELGIEQIFS